MQLAKQVEAAQVIIDRCCASLIEAFRCIARYSEHGAIEESNGITLIKTGIPFAMFNPAFVTRPPKDTLTAAQRAKAFYAQHKVPWQLVAVGEIADVVAPAAGEAGMVEGRPVSGMVLFPLQGQPPKVAGLDIRFVNEAAMLEPYNTTMAAGFGIDVHIMEMLHHPAFLSAPGVRMYLGFIDGNPVTTALSYCIDRIALVFNISTIPEYRRRGLGETMTWHAALEGHNDGCIASFLQASSMGEPVYRRMGFQPCVTFREWEQQHDA